MGLGGNSSVHFNSYPSIVVISDSEILPCAVRTASFKPVLSFAGRIPDSAGRSVPTWFRRKCALFAAGARRPGSARRGSGESPSASRASRKRPPIRCSSVQPTWSPLVVDRPSGRLMYCEMKAQNALTPADPLTGRRGAEGAVRARTAFVLEELRI